MPSWNDIQNRIKTVESPHDQVRHEYLKKLAEKTGRNVIAYYSGWLQHHGSDMSSIQDDDKNGFMNAIYKMDKKKGLDLISHISHINPRKNRLFSRIFYFARLHIT